MPICIIRSGADVDCLTYIHLPIVGICIILVVYVECFEYICTLKL